MGFWLWAPSVSAGSSGDCALPPKPLQQKWGDSLGDSQAQTLAAESGQGRDRLPAGSPQARFLSASDVAEGRVWRAFCPQSRGSIAGGFHSVMVPEILLEKALAVRSVDQPRAPGLSPPAQGPLEGPLPGSGYNLPSTPYPLTLLLGMGAAGRRRGLSVWDS